MAESVPTFFLEHRRSVAAYRHAVLLRVPLAMQGCASDECKR